MGYHMLLRDLDYFLRIAETGSLRRAATLSEVSQPAVTKGLRRLEAELGLTLVQRSSQGASLTEVGRSFLDRARRLRADFDIALQEANELRAGAIGLVRVGITPALVEPVFQGASMALLLQRPASRIRVQIALTDELLVALRRGDIDVMISGMFDTAPGDLRVLPLGESLLGVFARDGHPLMHKRPLQLADLTPYPWILPRRGVLSRDWLDGVFDAHELPRPVARMEFNASHDGLMSIVLASDALSVGGDALVRRMHRDGLRFVDLEALRWRRRIAAMTRAEAQVTPVLQRFLELLVADVPVVRPRRQR